MTHAEAIQQLIEESESTLKMLREEMSFQERYVATLRAKLNARQSATPKAVTPPPASSAPLCVPTLFEASKGTLTSEAIRTLSMPEKIVLVLREAKKPLRITDVTTRLEQLGVRTDAKKGLFPNVNSSFKRRGDLFVRQGRGIYSLKEWLIDNGAGEEKGGA